MAGQDLLPDPADFLHAVLHHPPAGLYLARIPLHQHDPLPVQLPLQLCDAVHGLFPGEFPQWMWYSFGIGIVLAGIGEMDFRDIGTVLGFPFSVIGSFSDVLSYIRLFAVGMSGFYLASCFNNMGLEMMKGGAAGVVFGPLVLLAGHLLNIALCALGVLVHGVRLNTLEFSSHLGLRWSGFAFAPFAKKNQ